ncbi:MAG: hypothetical protein ACUVTX_11885 [Bacteroidales bacterium]
MISTITNNLAPPGLPKWGGDVPPGRTKWGGDAPPGLPKWGGDAPPGRTKWVEEGACLSAEAIGEGGDLGWANKEINNIK